MAIKVINTIKISAGKFLTILRGKAKISKTREVSTPTTREMQGVSKDKKKSAPGRPALDSLSCPYCFSKNFVKRGWRQKKHERVQLYLCQECQKAFTAQITKGKHYPLATIFDAISLYNLGYSLEESCRRVRDRSPKGLTISAAGLSNWITEFGSYCPFLRYRYFVLKKYAPQDMVVHATLAHQQLFRYRFHQAKCEFIIREDFKHRRFGSLKEFLEMVPVECPHQYFLKGLRASEAPMIFSKKQMIVRAKQNFATELGQFVLQSVKDRKQRHNTLQKFMLYNDSVTVATEVPVYLTKDDLLHMQTQLGFEMYPKGNLQFSNPNLQSSSNESIFKRKKNIENSKIENSMKIANCKLKINELPKLITGHIDILQIRNGQIHILDYKPRGEKERPIEQLTLYAMALSRLTGLRLFEFKCAWFNENDYFEFYPLHVLYKPKKGRRRRKIKTEEGTYLVNKIKEKIERIRPV